MSGATTSGAAQQPSRAAVGELLAARGKAALDALVRFVRDRRVLASGALMLLALGLVPVFQANLTRPSDDYFFSTWDQHSQALVLGKIEQDTAGKGSTPFGLVATSPDSQQAYTDLDAIRSGDAPSATAYTPYVSSIGLQGHLFETLHAMGCSSLTCLNTAESGLFAVGFVLFAAALGLAVSRSLAGVFVVTGLLSPWVVSAAHNLYWVGWTWMLPAAAAGIVCLARRRRSFVIGLVLVGLAVAIKSATGYEYLTTVVALAAGMPLLARAFGRILTWRKALVLASWIAGAALAGFLAAVLVHALMLGGGDPIAGAGWILNNAERRTWATGTDADPLVTASHNASVAQVLGRYLFGWSTAILALGIGAGGYAIAAQGFWVMILIPSAIAGVLLVRGDPRGARYATVLIVSAVPPLSWLVLAKSHAFAETNMTYVLWYLPFVAALVWVVVDAVRSSRAIRGLRALGSGAVDAAGSQSAAEGRRLPE